jgi:hypothetical protein
VLWICEAPIRAVKVYATSTAYPTGGATNAIDTKGADYVALRSKGPERLTKVIPIIGLILMALHIIWPLDLPGLRKRRDFWKIAVVMGIAIIFTALLREQLAISP